MLLDEKETIINLAKDYVAREKDEVFSSMIKTALDNDDYDYLYECFYTSLAFGTAGLRGVIGGGYNRMNTYVVEKTSQGLATYLQSQFEEPSIIIAYDSRNYSQSFALTAAKVLASNNVKTYLFDTLHPVPMLSFSLKKIKASAGIVITASHNPSKYNGYKVYWTHGGQITPPHDTSIADLANNVKEIKRVDEATLRANGYLESAPEYLDTDYYNMVRDNLKRKELILNSKVVVSYSPIHGSGNVPVRTLLSSLNVETHVVKEQEEPNGDFPTVKMPNPESREAMSKAIELAINTKADIVLGTDPDADRLGIAIPKTDKKDDYLLLTGNQIATLISDYLLQNDLNNGKRPLIVKSLVTTDLIKKIASANNADCVDVLTGFKYIAEKIDEIEKGINKDNYFLFGCEESYGFLSNTSVCDKDAVSTAILAVEMMAYYKEKNMSLKDRLDEIYANFGYYKELVFSTDYEGASGKEKMASIMAMFRSIKAGDKLINKEVASTEDLLASTDFPPANVIIIKFTNGEKLIIRPSGTEPKIKYYIFLALEEDMSQEGLDSILNEYRSQL